METPALKLTPAARAELLVLIDRITEYRAIVSVVWSTAASRMRLLPSGEEEFENIGPCWDVGFYSVQQVPSEDIVHINGIPFAFGQGATSMRLNGAVVDFRDSHFVVTERAI